MKQYQYNSFNGDYIKFNGGTLRKARIAIDKAEKLFGKFERKGNFGAADVVNTEIDLFEKHLVKEQHEILLKNYSVEDMAEILGFYEGVGSSVFTIKAHLELEKLDTDSDQFKQAILAEARLNGNFEEVIKYGVYLPI